MSYIESHANGNDNIFLAVVGLKDLYTKEEEYDFFILNKIDFLVSSNIVTKRSSVNYGNEFLLYGSIEVNMLKSMISDY